MRRGRPEKLTPDIKQIIIELKLAHQNWKATLIHDELGDRLFNRIKRENPESPNGDITYEVEQQLPGLSTIQKFLKDKDFKLTELDKPWHLGAMSEYTIPSEAVPYIVGVQEWGEKTLDAWDQPHKPLTIRQALWVSRLYTLVESYLHTLDKKQKKDAPFYAAKFLWAWSDAYATLERVYKISGAASVDTSELDRRIREGDYPIVAEIFHNGVPIDSEGRRRIVFASRNKVISMYPPMEKEGETNERTHNKKG